MSLKKTIILALVLVLFTSLGINSIVTSEQKLQLKEVQLKDTSAELKQLNLKYDHLNVELDKVDKTKTEDIKRLEGEKQELQKQKEELERQVSAKKEAQRIANENASRAAQTVASVGTAKVSAQAPMASSGSGCEWLKGRLAANGVDAGDIPAAISIATRESGCRSSAVNPTSGACNVFQEYSCGKWGGVNNTDAHIQGANNYAKTRYGGWWKAYEFWNRSHWW